MLATVLGWGGDCLFGASVFCVWDFVSWIGIFGAFGGLGRTVSMAWAAMWRVHPSWSAAPCVASRLRRCCRWRSRRLWATSEARIIAAYWAFSLITMFMSFAWTRIRQSRSSACALAAMHWAANSASSGLTGASAAILAIAAWFLARIASGVSSIGGGSSQMRTSPMSSYSCRNRLPRLRISLRGVAALQPGRDSPEGRVAFATGLLLNRRRRFGQFPQDKFLNFPGGRLGNVTENKRLRHLKPSHVEPAEVAEFVGGDFRPYF